MKINDRDAGVGASEVRYWQGRTHRRVVLQMEPLMGKKTGVVLFMVVIPVHNAGQNCGDCRNARGLKLS